jgi:hypothetical protein
MSRTKKLLPKGGLEKIRDLASHGHSEKDIARALGMAPSTWTRLKDENPEAQDALDAGRSVEHLALYGKLYEKAMGGDIVALLFLLKCRHGYRELADFPQNAAQIIISLPAAATLETYKPLVVGHKPNG